MSRPTTGGRIVYLITVGAADFLKPTIVSSARKSIPLKRCVTSQAFKEARLGEADIMLSGTAFASSVTLLRGKGGRFPGHRCPRTALGILASRSYGR